jgi:alpha-ketoglutarate-dependent 2,4-dichlorophenoxyacetate dioxygenase
MELKILGPGFGAEVRGVGLAQVAANDEAYSRVHAAFEAHSVLLFRNQPITDELQVAFSRRFGPLATAKAASLGEGTPFSVLTNVDRATGALVLPDHKEALRARANQLWHTDSCFKAPPALASVLSAADDSADRRRDRIRVAALCLGTLARGDARAARERLRLA